MKPERKAELIEMMRNGVHPDTLAKQYNTAHQDTLRTWCRENGIKYSVKKGGTSGGYPQERIEEAKRLMASGVPIESAASRANISQFLARKLHREVSGPRKNPGHRTDEYRMALDLLRSGIHPLDIRSHGVTFANRYIYKIAQDNGLHFPRRPVGTNPSKFRRKVVKLEKLRPIEATPHEEKAAEFRRAAWGLRNWGHNTGFCE